MIINSLLTRLRLWLKPLPVGHFLLIALAIGLMWGSIGLAWGDVFPAYRQNSMLHLAIGGVLTLIILALGGIVLRQRTRVVRAPEPAPMAADFSSPASYRVLVAEDNSTNRLVVTRMLERQHHRVDVAVNGLEAVEAVRNIPYDLVLMDMMMPEMDGIAATLAIRTLDGARATVPIIGLTANVMAADQHACMAAGMTGFLTKPITAGRLAQAIDQAIDQAMAGRTHAIEEG